MVSSTGHMIAIIFLVIFLILFAVFLGLYIWTRNRLVNCEATRPRNGNGNGNGNGNTGPAPAPGPGPSPMPPNSIINGRNNIGLTNTNVAVAGMAPGEKLAMHCPLNRTIKSYKLMTTVVDGPGDSNQHMKEIQGVINPIGMNTFCESADKIMCNSNLPPDCFSRRKGVIPTRVLVGLYQCG